MARYRFELLGGADVRMDRSKPLLDADGKPTGLYERLAVRKGGIVESDHDLAAKEPLRYRLISGDAGPDRGKIADLERQKADLERQLAEARAEIAAHNLGGGEAAVFPGGQVSSGIQRSTGAGSTGAMTPDEIEKHEAKLARRQETEEPAKKPATPPAKK
jgi:hypothetical protein